MSQLSSLSNMHDWNAMLMAIRHIIKRNLRKDNIFWKFGVVSGDLSFVSHLLGAIS